MGSIAIYLFTFPNGKHYVGQSIDCRKRWIEHKYRSKVLDCIIHRAIRKYGWDNITKEVLLSTNNPEYANFFERAFISGYNSLVPFGYNSDTGGLVRKEISEITRQKISKASKGRKMTEEHKLALIQINTGRECSEATREKIRVGNLGKKMTLESRIKMSKSQTGIKRNYSEEAKNVFREAAKKAREAHSIPVYGYRKNNPNEILTFKNAPEAARFVGGKSGSHISECAKGKRKSAYKYIWSYNKEVLHG